MPGVGALRLVSISKEQVSQSRITGHFLFDLKECSCLPKQRSSSHLGTAGIKRDL